LAGARLFYEKIGQNVALFWFGLRNVVILYSQAAIQIPMVDFPGFLETGSVEDIAVCDHTTRDTSSGSELRSFFKNSRSKLKIKNL
jgi:hypothetical protein